MHSRSKILSLIGAVIAAAFAPSAQAQNPPLHTVRVINGVTLPLFVTAAPGDTSRIFILEQKVSGIGRVRILQIPSNTLLPTPFLTIPVTTGNEQGLLGMAFDPNYATNGFFYIFATQSGGGGAAGQEVVWRYTVMAGNPDVADPASALMILTTPDPANNHNGGWIGFGPDGYLYVSFGDGGSEGDPNHLGQNMTTRLSKMLRIDVHGDDYPTDATRNYAIPPTNPYFGMTTPLPEIFATGLRNPWRCSFDRLNGDLWIGDVGQDTYEEIDRIPAGQGGLNFGWSCMEGFHCYNTTTAGCTCNAATLTLPLQEYQHTGGNCSVTGGPIYRGSAICGLAGTYFYADYCTATIWSFKLNGAGAVTNLTNRTAELAPGGGLAINSITGFGEDANGEIYICDQGGEIFKIVVGTITDCNGNGIHDGCDIANGTSMDANGNGIPDECESSTTPYCFGTASACPCANNGAAGNGCANSLYPAGGNLYGTTPAQISLDSFTLIGTNMPDSSALYFQGTTQVAGGLGAQFGDGLRCAGGSIVRLATKLNSAGGSSYPEIFDTPISTRGGITTAPLTRTYQIWYRNAAAFCTPNTYNLTNAVSVLWVN